MEFNRNHYLTMGLVVLLLGVQFRLVKSYTLTEQSTQFISKQLNFSESPAPPPMMAYFNVAGTPQSKRQLSPPRWLGFSFISMGVVLVLQSFAMKKPGT